MSLRGRAVVFFDAPRPGARRRFARSSFSFSRASIASESCAAIAHVFWQHRMNLLTGLSKYADVMEQIIYNSGLSGVSIDGKRFCYTNPLRWHGADHELWSHDYHERHVPGLRHICCPTNVLRHIAAYQGYLFSTSKDTLWLHHYADCTATLKKLGLKLKETTDYLNQFSRLISEDPSVLVRGAEPKGAPDFDLER